MATFHDFVRWLAVEPYRLGAIGAVSYVITYVSLRMGARLYDWIRG